MRFPLGTGPRHFAASADNQYWYVIGELDARIHVLKRNPISGKSQLLERHALLSGDTKTKAWAADIQLSPAGNFLYASERSRSEIYAFAINNKSGRLTSVGKWNTDQQPRALRISADGRHLVVAGQVSNRISIYTLDSKSGALELIQSLPTGLNPSWVEIVALASPVN